MGKGRLWPWTAMFYVAKSLTEQSTKTEKTKDLFSSEHEITTDHDVTIVCTKYGYRLYVIHVD